MQNTKSSFNNNIQKRSEKDAQNRRNANFIQFENQTTNEKVSVQDLKER